MTQPNVFYFDDVFQQTMFALMMNDSDFCYKCCHLLKPEYFANQYYAKIFTTIQDLQSKMEGGPSPMMLFNELLKIREDEKPPYLTLFKKIIEPAQTRNYEYVRNQLEQFVKRSVVWQLNKKLVDSKAQDPDSLYQMAMKHFEQLQSVTFQEDNTLTPKNLELFLERNAQRSGKLLPMGLPNIDKALGGGLPKGTLTTVIGGTNIGKSIFLHNLASEWIEQGMRVLLINLEGVKEQPLLRIIARSTNIPYAQLRFNQLDTFQKKRVRDFEEKYHDLLEIRHVEEFNYSVEDMYSYCRDKKQKFAFDGLLVDYGQLLGTKSKQEGLRHSQAFVHRALASMGCALDCAVVTVAQGTRDVQDKNNRGNSLTRMNDISECFEINRVSAQVLTLNRSEIDEQKERCRILLDKQRDGMKGVIDICKTKFSTASLYGPVERGLGFLSADQYVEEEYASVQMPGKPAISEGLPQ